MMPLDGRCERTVAGRFTGAARKVQTGLLVGAVVAVVQAAALSARPPQAAGAQALATARAAAPVDLTGTWVSVVTEDWEARMLPPAKGDYRTVDQVMNAQARTLADSWQPSMDGRCEAYGVGGVMRMPGRLRISWQDDATLKIETDAGAQTRLLRFVTPSSGSAKPVPRTLQGLSVAEWQRGGGQQDAFLGRGVGTTGRRWGGLKVITTNMLAGWLRPNGVPYSERTTVTEHFTRFTHPVAGDWFVVTTVVEDPVYLTGPFITSTNFKKEPNDSKWHPATCSLE